ncbi:hypothetical protein BN132_4036 [Cronobacter turicensis 564]|nr:hypothetical protein BN132_4036 [Cronobacter turicensis 564]
MPVDFVSEIDFLHPPSRSARTRIKSLLYAMIKNFFFFFFFFFFF